MDHTVQDQDLFLKYPKNDPSVIIPLLQDIQERYGYLPEEKVRMVASYTGVSVSRVFGVATFYNQFRLKPLGKYLIRVCRGTACHVKGSKQILEKLEQELGCKAGNTSRDGMFTLETVACIGACSIAPVITIGDDFHGKVTSRDIPRLLIQYRKKATQPVEAE